MDPANVIGLTLPQRIAALEDAKLLGKEGERRCALRPIPSCRVTGRADRGYGTARVDTKLFSPFCLLVSLVLSPCLRYYSGLQSSRQSFRSPNLSRNSFGFTLYHRRCIVTGRSCDLVLNYNFFCVWRGSTVEKSIRVKVVL